MQGKFILLSVAVLSIGIFALPNTVSLFEGQHTWKNLTEVAGDNTCRKCHEDIYEEMHGAGNYVHWNVPGTKGTNDVFRCSECHTVDYDIGAYFQRNASGNVTGHAATTIACLSCHSGLQGLKAGGNVCFSCHNGPFGLGTTQPGTQQFPMHALAYKYGMGHPEDDPTHPTKGCPQCHSVSSTYSDSGDLEPTNDNVFIKLVNATITGTDEAHTLFYYQSKYPNQTTVNLKDANAACLGCHSHAGVNITWKRSIGYEMNVTALNTGWEVDFTGVSSTTNTTSSSGQ